MSAPIEERAPSAECALAQRGGYGDLHGQCRQTRDVPLTHSNRIVLMSRCGCPCHQLARGGTP